MLLRLQNAPAGTTAREPAPVRISVAMMVGNEAHFVRDAIASASWADEVVVLDTGSTDGTDEIAREMGAKVTREAWRTVDLGDGLMSINDFGAARTRSIELASGEWVVLLDADERFDCPDLRAVLETMPECVDVAAMRLEHVNRPELEQNMTRIFRRSAGPRYEHRVHETLEAWVQGRAHATIPREGGRVVHLGGDHETRKRYRREERNWRLVQRSLEDNRNDLHALAYAIETLGESGRDGEAEALARHAFALCTPTTPSRHRITLALCEFSWRRHDVAGAAGWIAEAEQRWALDGSTTAAKGLVLWLLGRHDEARGALHAALAEADRLSPVMVAQAQRALSEMERHAA